MLASIGEDMLDSPVQSGAEDDAGAPKVVKSRTESGQHEVVDAGSSRTSKFNDDDATNSQQHDDSAKSATEMNPDGA